MVDRSPPRDLFVRYGLVPEVARCQLVEGMNRPQRGERVVVETHRGPQLGEVLGDVRSVTDESTAFRVIRIAEERDLLAAREILERSGREFSEWAGRIAEWKIDLQLIDMEWTLDGEKLILYVLNERGPECTRLAIQAAASGFGIIEVQPVGPEGLVSLPSASGGCGSGGCGCSH